jgi:hypothetical protein
LLSTKLDSLQSLLPTNCLLNAIPVLKLMVSEPDNRSV